MQKTPKLGLNKPDLNDYVNIADLNENMDVLDVAVSELQEGTAIIPDLETTNKTLAGGINENKQNLAAHLADTKQHVSILSGITPDTPASSYPQGFSMFYISGTDSNLGLWADLSTALLNSTNRLIRCSVRTSKPETSNNGITQNLIIYNSAPSSAGQILGVFERTHYSNSIGWSAFKKIDVDTVIDRTEITVNTPPSGFPFGHSVFGETRASSALDWLAAMNAVVWSGYRLVIETVIAFGRTGAFQVHKQRVTYYSNTTTNPGTIRGIYERVSKITDEGEVWGEFYQDMTDLGGQYKAIVKAYPNTSYTVPQMRNFMLSPTEPTADMLGDGEVCLIYEG